MKQQNNWRDELRNRSIPPSDEAWLAIESGLENKSKNKLKKKFILSLVAASFIGFIVFVSLPTNTNLNPSETLAAEETQQPEEESVFPEALFLNTKSTIFSIENKANSKDEIPVSKKVNSSNTTTKHNKMLSEKRIASTENDATTQKQVKKSSEIHERAAQLLAEVEADLNSTSNTNTNWSAEDEAELLLAEAQLIIQQVEYQQLYEFAKASDLLAEAEHDLSKAKLQNRVWHFVKSNFQNLESAFASLR